MLIVKHPPYIHQAIGAEEDEVLLVHGPMSHADIKGGIRRVYEPRRACEYPVHLSDLREVK